MNEITQYLRKEDLDWVNDQLSKLEPPKPRTVGTGIYQRTYICECSEAEYCSLCQE